MNNKRLIGGYVVLLESVYKIETLGEALVAIVKNVVSLSQSLGFGLEGKGAENIIPQDNALAYDWARNTFYTNWDCQDVNNPVWFEEGTRHVYPNDGEKWIWFEYVTSGGFTIKISYRTHTGGINVDYQQWKIEIFVGNPGWGWKNSSLAQALRDAGWGNHIPAGDERRFFDAATKISKVLPTYLKLTKRPDFQHLVDLAGIFPVDYDEELNRLVFHTPHGMGERREAWPENPENWRGITYYLGEFEPTETPVVTECPLDDEEEDDDKYFGASTLAKLRDSKLFKNED